MVCLSFRSVFIHVALKSYSVFILCLENMVHINNNGMLQQCIQSSWTSYFYHLAIDGKRMMFMMTVYIAVTCHYCLYGPIFSRHKINLLHKSAMDDRNWHNSKATPEMILKELSMPHKTPIHYDRKKINLQWSQHT